MAKYLGKISAVVTANTADFTNKLNSAAGTVRKFAGEVQSNITGAMKGADLAFKSVLTPLQKLEASLKAASSMKLSFKGVDGAIRDIEGLKARMQTLKGTSVKLVLDASGFKSIDAYRNALDGLSKRGAKILVDVGGLDKAKAIQATLAASGNKTIKVGLSRINRDELDSVIAAVDKLGEEKIKTVIDVIGQADLDAAVLKTQQLFSASELLAKPLGRAVAEFDRLSYAVQAGFIPALSLTQNAVLGLEKDIKDGATVGVNEFDRLEKQVIKTGKSIQRLSEVAGLVGKIKTGQEFAFTDPKMNQRLTTAAAQGDQAAALPPDTLASNKNITPLIAQASELAQKIAETDAQIQRFGEGSFFASKLPQQLAVLGSALDSVNKKVATELRIQLDATTATSTANALKDKLASLAATLSAPTDPFEKLAASAVRAKAAVDALDDSAEKTALLGQLGLQQQQLQRMAQPGFIASPNAIGSSERNFDRIANEATNTRGVQLDTTAANASVAALRKDLASIAETMGEPSVPIVRMTKAINESVAAVAALNDGLEKTALQSQLGGLRATLAGAGAGSGPLPPDLITDAERQARAVTAGAGAAAAAQAPPLLGPRAGGIDSGNDIKNQMALLQSSTVAAKAQLDQLPISLRSRFVPAIQAAEAEFYRLKSAAGATSEEIENAGNKVAKLKTAMSAGGSIKMSGAVIDDGAIGTSIGRLNAMQQILLKVGATAGGPVAAAYDRLAQAQARVLAAGSAGTPAAAKFLKIYEDAAIRAAVATGRISKAEAERKVKQGGDVGRGGMDRFSMAANQAAFALDDFFSSVGGWDQKLRAVSNNVTQLGFVLGGTTGLFVGLGAVLAGQVAVGILKWINAGRTSEDQTKALNEALSRQKSLVDDLAQSFRGLADAIGRGMFSEGASAAIDFGKSLSDIKRKQKEMRDSRKADIDPEVQKERANQARDTRLMDKSESIPDRLTLARQIRESKQREMEATSAAVTRGGAGSFVTGLRAKAAIRGSIERRLNADVESGSYNAGQQFEENRQRASREAQALPQNVTAQGFEALKAAIEDEIRSLTERMKTSGVDQGNSTVTELETLLRDLEDPLHTAIDNFSVEIAMASNDAAQRIAAAQKDVASAIERGVPGAIAFQRELDSNAAALASANETLAQASKITDTRERQRAVDRADAGVAKAEKDSAGTEAKRRSMRLGMTQGGDRTKDALSSLQGSRELMNSRAVSVGRDALDKENAAMERVRSGASAGQRALAEKESRDASTAVVLATQNQRIAPSDANQAALAAAEKSFAESLQKLADAVAASKVDDEALKIAQAESEAAAALMELTRALEDSVSRLRKISSDAVSTSTQMADKAQRDFTEQKPVEQGGMPRDELKARRDHAENNLLATRYHDERAQAALTRARERAESANPEVKAANEKLESINQSRREDEAKMLELRAKPGGATFAEEQLASFREEMRSRAEADGKNALAAAMAEDPNVKRAQAEADAQSQKTDKLRQNSEAAAAGRELALTPRARQAQEMAVGVNKLKQAGLETKDNAERARFINDGAKNLRAQAAPMIEAMNNSRLSAILEGNNGPSRQALKVSDVNTMEGQSEMNRLLRGDDAAKNVDLEELRKQTQALTDLNKMVGEAKQALGVA